MELKPFYRRDNSLSQVIKNIQIVLTTTIIEKNEQELFYETYIGSYKRYGEVEIITFLENDENFGEIDYRIVIRPNKVQLSRSGQLSLQQKFDLNKKSESLYK